jgi:FMN phosphatase YigB (HAD superfamily)
MAAPRIELLVLDAQGVVLNSPLLRFLAEFARLTDQSPCSLIERWRSDVRDLAWVGAITDSEVWRQLAPDRYLDSDPLIALESHYHPGPAAIHLPRWSERVPIWVLSNHRTHWLIPRLERFDLTANFERILVSDRLGAAKPNFAAFAPVLSRVSEPGAALFVDDTPRNVDAARRLGLRAILADDPGRWLGAVDAELPMAETS